MSDSKATCFQCHHKFDLCAGVLCECGVCMDVTNPKVEAVIQGAMAFGLNLGLKRAGVECVSSDEALNIIEKHFAWLEKKLEAKVKKGGARSGAKHKSH